MPARVSALLAPQFLRFCVVGGLGLLTDQTIFFLLSRLVDPASSLVNLIWTVGYAVAVLQNYLINHYWTFKEETRDTRASGKGLFAFFLISAAALLPRFAVYKTVLLLFGVTPLVLNLANLCGIAAGTVVNFLGSKFLVFTKRS